LAGPSSPPASVGLAQTPVGPSGQTAPGPQSRHLSSSGAAPGPENGAAVRNSRSPRRVAAGSGPSLGKRRQARTPYSPAPAPGRAAHLGCHLELLALPHPAIQPPDCCVPVSLCEEVSDPAGQPGGPARRRPPCPRPAAVAAVAHRRQPSPQERSTGGGERDRGERQRGTKSAGAWGRGFGTAGAKPQQQAWTPGSRAIGAVSRITALGASSRIDRTLLPRPPSRRAQSPSQTSCPTWEAEPTWLVLFRCRRQQLSHAPQGLPPPATASRLLMGRVLCCTRPDDMQFPERGGAESVLCPLGSPLPPAASEGAPTTRKELERCRGGDGRGSPVSAAIFLFGCIRYVSDAP